MRNALLLSCSVLLTTCIKYDNPRVIPEDAIQILTLNEKTGALAYLGDALERSMRLATDEINAAGGVLGRQLVLVTADTHTDPVAALEEAEFYYSKSGNIVAIAGAVSDDVSKEILKKIAGDDIHHKVR